jgi:hypothetical protein
MTRRFFWQLPEFVKFRTVFENEDTVLGVNDHNEHKLFRKDSGSISFDEYEALKVRLAKLAERPAPDPVRLVPRFPARLAVLTH